MNLPDETSRAYARILPELEHLGHRVTMRAGAPYGSDRFTIGVDRNPTIHVSPTGEWHRDDGAHGCSPDDLLLLHVRERLEGMEHRHETGDRRGMSLDLLAGMDARPSAILALDCSRASWRVEYRPRAGCPEIMVIDHPISLHSRQIRDLRTRLRALDHAHTGRNR